MWESHAEGTDSWSVRHSPERPRVVCRVVDENTDSKPEVFIADAASVATTGDSHPICELLIQRLMGTVHPVQPVLQERSNLMDIENFRPDRQRRKM